MLGGNYFGGPYFGQAYDEPTGAATQTVNPNGIASVEALGVVTATPGAVNVSPIGIQSSQAAGYSAVSSVATIAPVGVNSAEGVGAIALSLSVTPVGTSTAETSGVVTVTPGPVTISPVGISTAGVSGVSQVTASYTVSPIGASSSEGLGVVTLGVGITPTGIASAQTLGAAAVTPGAVTVSPIGIPTAEALGSPTVSSVATVSPNGIASNEFVTGFPARRNLVTNPSFEADTPGSGSTPAGWTFYGGGTYLGVANDFGQYGSQSLKASQVTNMDGGFWIRASGIPLGSTVTASAWLKTDANVTNASLVLNNGQHGLTGGISQAFHGGANANSRVSVTASNLDTTDIDIFIGQGSFGVQSNGTVWWDGIMLEVSGAAGTYFDGATNGGVWEGTANASTSVLAVGVTTSYAITPTAIPPVEKSGAVTVTPGAVTIAPVGIQSAEGLGTANVSIGAVTLTVVGIPSAQAAGSSTVSTAYTISPTGIASGEQLGQAVATPGAVTVSPVGVPTGQALGSPTTTGANTVSPVGVSSGQVSGNPALSANASVSPAGISSSERVGTPTLTPGTVIVSVIGIGSGQTMGVVAIVLGSTARVPFRRTSHRGGFRHISHR